MSQEFYQTIASMHDDIAARFAANNDGKKRHVTCRVDDCIYVYLHEDGVHVQTQEVHPPEAWWENWPSEATVRRYVRQNAIIGSVHITSMDA